MYGVCRNVQRVVLCVSPGVVLRVVKCLTSSKVLWRAHVQH